MGILSGADTVLMSGDILMTKTKFIDKITKDANAWWTYGYVNHCNQRQSMTRWSLVTWVRQCLNVITVNDLIKEFGFSYDEVGLFLDQKDIVLNGGYTAWIMFTNDFRNEVIQHVVYVVTGCMLNIYPNGKASQGIIANHLANNSFDYTVIDYTVNNLY